MVVDWLHLGHWCLMIIFGAVMRGLVHVDHWLFPAVVQLLRHEWLARDGGAVDWLWLVLKS